MSRDTPVIATAKVEAVLSERTFRLELPNGKLTLGHLPKRLHSIRHEIAPGCQVHVEITPYDFEKARITALRVVPS